MKGIGKILNKKCGELIFSLLCGCAYFVIVLSLFLQSRGGALLGFFFFPAIVCASALVILKLIKRLKEEEAYGKINALIYIHILLLAIGAVFFADIVL